MFHDYQVNLENSANIYSILYGEGGGRCLKFWERWENLVLADLAFYGKTGEPLRNDVYTEFFLEIPHDEKKKKNLDEFIFPLLLKMCYKIIA